MTINKKYSISALLILSSLLLASLVPGGLIETRDFSHIDPIILATFNTFLTFLLIASFFLVYFILKSKRWTMVIAALLGFSYFGVYILDLIHIFPVSPDAMSPALLWIEICGTIVSLPLMILAIQSLQNYPYQELAFIESSQINQQPLNQMLSVTLMIFIILISLSIIIFATRSAMGL